MKSLIASLAVVLTVVSGAAAAIPTKGVPATVLVGGQGVRAPDGSVRYITLTSGRNTVVSVVRVQGGQVVRWRLVPGNFGVPVISLDGGTDGVSRDGRKLVLAMPSGGSSTQFAVLDTRSLKLRKITLRGSWSYDAIAPDASTLYLIQYTGAGPDAAYSVRAFDLDANRLLARPVVDRAIGERLMRGWPVTRATTTDGRWAYTLYARQRHEPFVHALDTSSRKAYCIDLPLDLGRPEQMGLRLRLRRDLLEVRAGRETVAAVDTSTFAVHTH
jgi:hypothetical protein